MVNSKLIEQLQLPTSDNNLWEALRFVLVNDIDADTKFLATTALSKIHEEFNIIANNAGLTEYLIQETDTPKIIRNKCKYAFNNGIKYQPILEVYGVSADQFISKEVVAEAQMTPNGLSEESNPYDSPDYALSAFGKGFVKKKPLLKKPLTLKFVDIESGLKKDDEDYDLDEAESSTERVRKYYKRHPEKVRKYLRDTVKDRVARNRDRAKAVKKHGKEKMKNHDVHHPNGAQNGNWKLAKKDHGRDKKNESINENSMQEKINHFLDYAAKILKIQQKPSIAIVAQTPNISSLGSYNPETKQIRLVTDGRLIADVLRTLAHELVHVRQDELGKIKNPVLDGATGSDIENEANILAGVLLRDYGKNNKDIFMSNNMVYENTITYLTEGGAAGHLAHPYEDDTLKFSDVKEMIKRGLVGGLDAEAPVTEKLDGQNIMFTVRDGQVVFARNKGQIKNRGKNALPATDLRQMFAGRGDIEKSFGGAAEDLTKAIAALPQNQRDAMFANGSKFMNVEIIFPDTKNVIPYDKSVLVFHGTVEYDEEGNEVGRNIEDSKTLSDQITKVNAQQQKTFGISGPRSIAFSDADTARDKEKMREYASQVSRIQSEYGLDDNSTIEDYKREWWSREIDNTGIDWTPEEKEGLITRWALGEKKFGVKNIEDPEKKKFFREYEANKLANTQKIANRPLESIFLRVGADTLRRVTNTLSANNPELTASLKKELLDTIRVIKDTDDVNKLAKLQTQIERLDDIGIDKVVPTEGIVFIYKGKPYKFTGTFAPVNQILGTLKFAKGKAEETPVEKSDEPPVKEPVQKTEKPTTKPSESRTVAIFTGRFQPFHAGHYSIYEAMVKKFGKENVYIASSDKTDATKSPFEFKDKKQIMTRMFDIPDEMIVQVKNPYAPKEILEKLPPDTIYVTAVSQKDSSRLGGKYFTQYDDVPETDKKGYADQGYYIIAPEMQLQINGKNISGTQLRAVMGDPQITDRAKQEIFTKVYGKFDKKIFDNIVKITTDSEEARKLTDKHGEKKPSAKKASKKAPAKKKAAPDKKSVARARSVLKQKVRNPKTNRDIYVATALTYDPSEPVRKAAEKIVQNAMKQNESYLLENNRSSENLEVYIQVRNHTDEELKHEIEEYFKNERTLKAFPNLADSSYELKDMIQKAPVEVLDTEELSALENSDVGDILKGSNKQKILKKLINNKKDVIGLLKDIKAEKKISPPVVVKHVNGYYLLGGNTRLSVLASLGKTMPVKVLFRSAPLDAPVNVYPAKAKSGAAAGKKNAKGLFKSILQMRITNPETGNEIKIDTAMDYDKNHPAHKAAMAVIRQKMRGLSNRAGIPKQRSD